MLLYNRRNTKEGQEAVQYSVRKDQLKPGQIRGIFHLEPESFRFSFKIHCIPLLASRKWLLLKEQWLQLSIHTKTNQSIIYFYTVTIWRIWRPLFVQLARNCFGSIPLVPTIALEAACRAIREVDSWTVPSWDFSVSHSLIITCPLWKLRKKN